MQFERRPWIMIAWLALALPTFGQDGRRFERATDTAAGWVRIDADGQRWRVDPEVITVRFVPSVESLADFQQLADSADVSALKLVRSNALGFHDLRVPPGSDVLAVIDRVRATGLTLVAEENTIGAWLAQPDDGLFPVQWALQNNGQSGGTPGADIHMTQAWDITTGDPSVILATPDSGVEIWHPDLVQNLWKNTNEIPGNLIDDDNNGFVDDCDGWDFETNTGQVSGTKDHGTRLAGIMGAGTNNSIGTCGVAGGWGGVGGCRVMPLKVGDFAPLSQLLDDAILYAGANGARVINFSFKVASSSAIDAALVHVHDNLDVFLTGASGNFPETTVIYPARHPAVVAVPATDHNDQKANYSVSGPENWVAAPGIVLTPVLKALYATGGGTSFSAPHVAGVAGLMLSILPGLSPDEIRAILKQTADDIGPPGYDQGTGWGRINAHAALLHVLASDCNQNGLYDPGEISAGTSFDVNQNGVPDECEIITYCTAKLNSCATLPSLTSTGKAQASSSSGFTIEALNARPNRLGIFLYTDQGAKPQATPFQGGYLCIAQRIVRGVQMLSSGTGSNCNGSFAIDWNAFAAGALGGKPKAYLGVPGTRVDVQCWGRDTNLHGSYLSDALRFYVGP